MSNHIFSEKELDEFNKRIENILNNDECRKILRTFLGTLRLKHHLDYLNKWENNDDKFNQEKKLEDVHREFIQYLKDKHRG